MAMDKEEYKVRSTGEVLDDIIKDLDGVLNITSSDIPNIDLYMDQVLSFLDDKLKKTKRCFDDEEEKILTKTMINNYAKNDLLPPPVKKKYSKEHMMVLIFIYYFKNFLSINDIQTMLKPITDEYFDSDEGMSLEDLYSEIFNLGGDRIPLLKEDLLDKYNSSMKAFPDVEGEDGDYLRLFTYICYLSYDIFIKKMLVEQLIDEVKNKEIQKEMKQKKKEKNEKKK